MTQKHRHNARTDISTVASYTVEEASNIFHHIVNLINDTSRKLDDQTITRVKDLLLLSIDMYLYICYLEIHYFIDTESSKLQLVNFRDKTADLYISLLFDAINMKEANYHTGLSPISAELALQVKEKLGWIFPIVEGVDITSDDSGKYLDITKLLMEHSLKYEGKQRQTARKKGLAEIDKDLADRVKKTMGWSFPTKA